MAILDILEFPDPRLRTVAQPVKEVDQRVQEIVDNMFETMYDAPGIGLAATQVNIHERIITIDVSEDKSEPLVFINPESPSSTAKWRQCRKVVCLCRVSMKM